MTDIGCCEKRASLAFTPQPELVDQFHPASKSAWIMNRPRSASALVPLIT
jgi:hypothetical protein